MESALDDAAEEVKRARIVVADLGLRPAAFGILRRVAAQADRYDVMLWVHNYEVVEGPCGPNCSTSKPHMRLEVSLC